MSEKGLTEKTSFERLKMALDYVGFGTVIKPVSQENKIEQLFVSIPDNDDQQVMVVQMLFADEIFQSDDDGDNEEASILQFIIRFPVQQKEDKFWQMYRLLTVFNGLLPIGAFSENETDGIYYRYSLIMPEREADNAIIVEILNMINFFVGRLSKKIIEFAETDKSFDEIVREAEASFTEELS